MRAVVLLCVCVCVCVCVCRCFDRARFLNRLRRIIELYPKIVTWSPDGSYFHILDVKAFETHVLPVTDSRPSQSPNRPTEMSPALTDCFKKQKLPESARGDTV